MERRKGGDVAQREAQRPKRRRLNPDSPSKRKGTPTRASPRLSRQTPANSKTLNTVIWEVELPNATAAVDRALLKISSCPADRTNDLWDEIADEVTQALFEDVRNCEGAAANDSKRDPIELKAEETTPAGKDRKTERPKTERPKDRNDRENDEANTRKTFTPEKRGAATASNSTVEVIVVDSPAPPPSNLRQSPGKRKDSVSKKKSSSTIEPERKERRNQERGRPSPRENRKRIPNRKGTHSKSEAGDLQNCNGGLVEEVVEIEELYVDGGVASERTTKARRDTSLKGDVEEQVLDRSESKSVSNSEANNATAPAPTSTRLPWWRISGDNLERTSKTEKQLLSTYVSAIIRTCLRETWNAETLRENYVRDPSSNKGQAFLAVHTSLQLFERARYIRECETRWRPELLRELMQRQEVDWSVLRQDKKFDQFAGCDACLGHRRATARLFLKGKRYDASDFWPGTSRLNVLSSQQVNDRKLSVSAELRGETTNDHLIRIGANENEVEFWVDSNCLRKCLLFHELVHSTASIARDFRTTISTNLGRGAVELKLSSKDSSGNGLSVSERLERYLLRSALHDKEYVQNHVAHLTDIIRLGDVYFSSPDAEVLDSGNPGKSVYVPSIYDAPLDLGDEEYKQRIDQVITRNRKGEKHGAEERKQYLRLISAAQGNSMNES